MLTTEGRERFNEFTDWVFTVTGAETYISGRQSRSGRYSFQILVKGEPVEFDAGPDCTEIEKAKAMVRLAFQ